MQPDLPVVPDRFADWLVDLVSAHQVVSQIDSIDQVQDIQDGNQQNFLVQILIADQCKRIIGKMKHDQWNNVVCSFNKQCKYETEQQRINDLQKNMYYITSV